jgi:hypothetical protein
LEQVRVRRDDIENVRKGRKSSVELFIDASVEVKKVLEIAILDSRGIDILIIVLQVKVLEKDIVGVIESILKVVLKIGIEDGVVGLVGRTV